MQEFDILGVVGSGSEQGGFTTVIKLETRTGPILLRLPIDHAKHLADVANEGMNRAAGNIGDLPEGQVEFLGSVDTVKRAFITKAQEGDAQNLYMFIETLETGSHNFLLTRKAAIDFLVNLVEVIEKPDITH